MNKPVKFLTRGLLMNLAWLSRTFRINRGFVLAVIPYAVKYWLVDNSKAKNELGGSFRPAKEILEPTLEWLVKEGIIKIVKK